MEYQFFTYIVSSESAVLYIGMTNNLFRRIQEHKEGLIEGFSKKYGCKKLVYYETTKYIYNAIEREKEIKGWRREKKVRLIESLNPDWKELYDELLKQVNRSLVPRDDKRDTEIKKRIKLSEPAFCHSDDRRNLYLKQVNRSLVPRDDKKE